MQFVQAGKLSVGQWVILAGDGEAGELGVVTSVEIPQQYPSAMFVIKAHGRGYLNPARARSILVLSAKPEPSLEPSNVRCDAPADGSLLMVGDVLYLAFRGSDQAKTQVVDLYSGNIKDFDATHVGAFVWFSKWLLRSTDRREPIYEYTWNEGHGAAK